MRAIWFRSDSSAWVLDLHSNRAAVGPDRFVNLADRGRSGRLVGERSKKVAPVGPELAREDFVNGRRRERRCVLLQSGECFAIRRRQFLWHRRLEDRHRLPDLHRAALEFAKDLEELLGGALLERDHDLVGGLATQALAEPDGRSARSTDRKPSESRGSADRATRDVTHATIVRYRAPHDRRRASSNRMRGEGTTYAV
jgi:hypothetical protein